MSSIQEGSSDLGERAIRALVKDLGFSDTARFLREIRAVSGDYTKDRRKWLGSPTVDQLIAEIRAMRADGRLPRPPDDQQAQ